MGDEVVRSLRRIQPVALKGDALDETKGEFKDNLSVAMLADRIRIF